MTAREVFNDYLVSIGESYRGCEVAKQRVLAVWAANGHPLIVAAQDPRHGDDGVVYFIFQITPIGATFTTHYTLPIAENLDCPPHIASPGAPAPCVDSEESAPTAGNPAPPDGGIPDARMRQSATSTAT